MNKGVCPLGDLLPALATRPEMISTFGDPNVNFVGVAPLTTSHPRLASGPRSPSAQPIDFTKVGRPHAFRLMGVSIATLVAVCMGIGLWLLYRHLAVGSSPRRGSAQR